MSQALAAMFAAAPPGRERYAPLVDALTAGFDRHAVMDGAGAAYPGPSSINGRVADRMEGFARMAPLWAAWIAGGGEDRGFLDRLARGLSGGPRHWGPIGDRDQKLCEAADLALALWLVRDRMAAPPAFTAWLQGAPGRAVADNNWHVFAAIILAVLPAIGGRAEPERLQHHLGRAFSFLRPDGLFHDGPDGRVDWYNAYCFHYGLGWIEAISGPVGWITEARGRAAPIFHHLLSPNGPVIFGRSLHYRAASPAPLTIGARLGDIDPGLAAHALDTTFDYFLPRGLVRDGRVTLGYHGDDHRWADAYAGPASPLWSMRALVPALSLGAGHAVWTGPRTPLPVEAGSFTLPIGRCTLHGDRASGHLRLLRPAPPGPPPRFERMPALARARAALRGRSTRTANTGLRYDLPEYSTAQPFCLAA